MFTLPDLPYAYNALEPYIDERTMRIHHGKHHAAYVNNLNEALANVQQYGSTTIQQLMGALNQLPESIRTSVRNNGGGHYNHSLFWAVMCAPAVSQKTVEHLDTLTIYRAITGTFGSLEKFQEQFTTTAMSVFGSGWAWLSLDNGVLNVEKSANQDSPFLEGRTPILGLDVWEHAYYLTYQNRRAEYVKNWWNVVHWREVERRFLESQT